MFPLHETTRKRTCRAAFVLLCVVPTLLTAAWVAWFHRPWRHADFQQTLSRELHLTVTLGRHECPRPGVVRLSDVRLYDLRWNRHLATIDKLNLRHQNGRFLLTAGSVQLESAPLAALGRAVEAWLAGGEETPVQLRIRRLSMARKDGKPLELAEIFASSELADDDLARLWVQAKLFGQKSASTMRMVVDRDVEQDMPLVRVTLDTQNVALPLWALSGIVPGGRRCGECEWQGTAQVQHRQGQTSGTLQGEISRLKLQQLLGSNSGHTLVGRAALTLDAMRWTGNRIESVRGQLHAGEGRVSRSLLKASVKHLFCQLGSAGHGETVQFDELACKFRLNESGITLEGNAGKQTGCLLAAGGEPLLMQPRYTQLPTAQLVQMLSPPSKAWLPATLEAQHLADVLPLPSQQNTKTASRPAQSSDQTLLR